MDQLPIELIRNLISYLPAKELDSFASTSKFHNSQVGGPQRAYALTHAPNWRDVMVNKFLGRSGTFFNNHEFHLHQELEWEATIWEGDVGNSLFTAVEPIHDIRLLGRVLVADTGENGTVALVEPSGPQWGAALKLGHLTRVVVVLSRNGLLTLLDVEGPVLYSSAKARAVNQWDHVCRMVRGSAVLGGVGGVGISHSNVLKCHIDETARLGVRFQPCDSSIFYSVLNTLQYVSHQTRLVVESVGSVLAYPPPIPSFPPDRSPHYWSFPL